MGEGSNVNIRGRFATNLRGVKHPFRKLGQ